MTKAKYQALVDEAVTLDQEIKEKEAVLGALKARIKETAKDMNMKVLEGTLGKATVSPNTITEVGPRPYWTLMNELDLVDGFFDTIKVQIASARALVGEAMFEKVAITDTIPWAKVSFKAFK